MTQDFAKQKNRTKTKRNSTRKPAKSRKTPKRSPKRNTHSSEKSTLLWFSLGLVCGVFLSLLVYLALQSNSANPQTEEKPASTKSNKAKAQANTQKTQTKPQKPVIKTEFEFYQKLKNDRIVVDERPIISNKPKRIYYLQTGSFGTPAQADELKGKLILQGLDITVHSSQAESGKIWYKVVAGPYYSRSKMAAAQSRLINQGINPLVLSKKIENNTP